MKKYIQAQKIVLNLGKESQKKHSFFLSIPKISPPPLLPIWAIFFTFTKVSKSKSVKIKFGFF